MDTPSIKSQTPAPIDTGPLDTAPKDTGPLDDTDLCVMCGMCLPHCPTYLISQNEAESPRGRLSLIQAYARGQLDVDKTLISHLDHCLGCLACESVCPSKVPFGQLMDRARQLTYQQRKPSLLLRQLLKATSKPGGMERFQPLINWSNITGLSKLIGPAKLLARAQTRRSPNQLADYYPAIHSPGINSPRGSIALFTGCMGKTFDADTLEDTAHLLSQLGFNVHVPQNQFCCGALHQHNGSPDTSQQLAASNQELFKSLDIDAIVFTANGCGAQLANQDFSVPMLDLASFLLEHAELDRRQFNDFAHSVIVHESCSSKNRLKIKGRSEQLLQFVPGLSIQHLNMPDLCCGAGGSHQLLHGDIAGAVLDMKLQDIDKHPAQYLLSDNLGCSLHIQTGLQQRGLNIEVLHPVSLLARQLKRQDDKSQAD